jgi:hypothetical protein
MASFNNRVNGHRVWILQNVITVLLVVYVILRLENNLEFVPEHSVDASPSGRAIEGVDLRPLAR